MTSKTGTDAARTALALMTAAVNDRDTDDSISDMITIVDSLSTEETMFVLVALATLGASLSQELANYEGVNARVCIQQLALHLETNLGVPSSTDEV